MTIAANHQAGPVLAPGTAQETIREMASVIRTVFGVGLQSSRRTAELAAARADAEAAASALPAPTQTGPALSVVPPTGSGQGAPTSIPMPDLSAGIPVPGIAVPGITMDEADAVTDQPEAVEQPQAVEQDEPETPTFTVPVLAEVPPLVPVPAPIEPRQPEVASLSNERRAALLQELAFLDD